MSVRKEVVVPHSNGVLDTAPLASFPFGAGRMEARLENGGRRLRIGVWGGGELATATAVVPGGNWSVRPNLVQSGSCLIAMAQSKPALLVRGSEVRLRPARKPLADLAVAATSARRKRTAEGVEYYRLPWGSVALARRGDEFVIGAGADVEEAIAAACLSAGQIEEEARSYASSCARLEVDDPFLGSMFAHSLHAALAAIKRDADGEFAGLAAGPGYSLPPRTYFRDAYWTVPALLPTCPDAVYQTLTLLASGIHPDGEAPSAVITPMQLPDTVGNAIRAHKGTGVFGGEYARDWWRDHFDSPLMFINMLEEYVSFTGDDRPVEAYWHKVLAILKRYRDYCSPGSDLPLKPYNERDWADNVFRSGLVTYDLGLYHGALMAAARLAGGRDERLAASLLSTAARVRTEATKRLWNEEAGHFDDYRTDGFAERHLSIDALTAVRFGLADDRQSRRMLSAVERLLETRNNERQPHGDFGVMCCYPPYSKRADLKAKSAFPYRYHNGADWPYWDGLYAGLRMSHGMNGWRYPLLRWWEYSLEQGWATPVEFFSPPYAPGAQLQAWSAMPAASIMREGFGVLPPFEARTPPWGRSRLVGIHWGTRVGTLECNGAEVSFHADDEAASKPRSTAQGQAS